MDPGEGRGTGGRAAKLWPGPRMPSGDNCFLRATEQVMPLYPSEEDQRPENEDRESESSVEGVYTSDTELKNTSQSGSKGSSDGKYDSDDETEKELEEVTRRVNKMKKENQQLRCELRSLEEQCMKLESENASIVENLKKFAGSDAEVASLLADMGVDLSEGDSPKDKIIIWPSR